MAKRPKSTIPRYKRRRKGSLIGRIVGWIVKLILAFLIISILWVLAYRFVNPPITVTMIGDMVAGRGAHKRLDADLAKSTATWFAAAIAAEDSKFCSHQRLRLRSH